MQLQPNGFQLNVMLPSLRNRPLEAFETKVEGIVKTIRARADKTGVGVPNVIVFSENSLKYMFDVTPCEISHSIDRLQKILPPSPAIVVGFSVLEKNGHGPRNMGYIFSADARDTSQKRMCTNFDNTVLQNEYYDEDLWEADGNRKQADGKNFGKISLGAGPNIELRVCFDVTARPIQKEDNTVTIVPAYNLDPGETLRLALRRQAVIVNDGGGRFRGRRLGESGLCFVSTNESGKEVAIKTTNENIVRMELLGMADQ